MADTTTTNYGLTKPEVGASEDTWGTKINTNLDTLDTTVDSIQGKSGAGVLKHTNNTKLATTSTGIDVTGTVVADGLNVQNGSNAGITFDLTTNYSPVIKGSQAVSDLYLAAVGGGGINLSTTDKARVLIQNNGDISFYEDTGTTPKLFWDASAESLGIGTSSPAFVLDVAHASDNGLARFTSGDADAYITIGDVNSTSAHNKIGVITHDMYFNTNGTERLRVDASGNLLVSKTASDGSVAGHELRAGSFAIHTRDNGPALYARRIGAGANDSGDVQVFENADGKVASMGFDGVNLYVNFSETNNVGIASGTSGGVPVLFPTGRDGGVRDDAVSLGYGTGRWKDIYLSGGVYLGGTGAANKLDSYEEGTFTATLTAATSAPTTGVTTTAYYTKTGNVVNVFIRFSNKDTSGASGSMLINGLPFTSRNVAENQTAVPMMHKLTISEKYVTGYIAGNSTSINFINNNSNGVWTATQINATTAVYLNINMTYQTA